MADVFISYHEKSAGEIAAKIAAALEEAGISCWYAKRDIPLGGDFARYIPPQIDACKVFLLILTENVYRSNHVENEVGLAFSRLNKGENITILPLEIGDFERKTWVKYYLVHTQSVKMPHPNVQNMQNLLAQIADILGKAWLLPIESGECGDNVAYTLCNGELTVFGAGVMRNYNFDERTLSCNTPWWNKRKNISSVYIQDGVTSIGAFSFNSCANLSRVEIPDSVTEICAEAFYRCGSLREIKIPDSVRFIRKFAFNESGLTEITIPKNAKTGWRTFPKGVVIRRK